MGDRSITARHLFGKRACKAHGRGERKGLILARVMQPKCSGLNLSSVATFRAISLVALPRAEALAEALGYGLEPLRGKTRHTPGRLFCHFTAIHVSRESYRGSGLSITMR